MPEPIGLWSPREILALRLAHRMTVRQFAPHIGINKDSLNRWENDRGTPSAKTRAKLDHCLSNADLITEQRFYEILAIQSEMQ